MRLDSEQGKVACHRAFGDTRLLRHAAYAPVGRVWRPTVKHLAHQRCHPFIVVAARTSGPQFAVQPGNPTLTPAAPPMANGWNADPAAPSNNPIGDPVRRHQHDPRTPHQRMRQAPRAGYRIQLFALRRTHPDYRIRPAHRENIITSPHIDLNKLFAGHNTRWFWLSSHGAIKCVACCAPNVLGLVE